jgi:hypothetical protein
MGRYWKISIFLAILLSVLALRTGIVLGVKIDTQNIIYQTPPSPPKPPTKPEPSKPPTPPTKPEPPTPPACGDPGCPTPTPKLTPTPIPTGEVVPTPTATPVVSTPVATPAPTQTPTETSNGGSSGGESGGGSVLSSDQAGQTGKVLGAADMAKTGTIDETLFTLVFIAGCLFTTLGVRKITAASA